MEVEPFYSATDELLRFVDHFGADDDAQSVLSASGDAFDSDEEDARPRQRLRTDFYRGDNVATVETLRQRPAATTGDAQEERLTRLRLLAQDSNARYLQLLAGHADQELVDLLDDDKLARVQQQRDERARLRELRERPARELEQQERLARQELEQLEKARRERQQLQRDAEEVVEAGRALIDAPHHGVVALTQALYDVACALPSSSDPVLSEEQRRAWLALVRDTRGETAGDASFTVNDDDARRGFARIVLHRYLLSNTSLVRVSETTRAAAEALNDAAPLLEAAAKVGGLSLTLNLVTDTRVDALAGSETVRMEEARRLFGEEGLRVAAAWGAQHEYGAEGRTGQYAEMVAQFATGDDAVVADTFAAKSDHPARLRSVLDRVPASSVEARRNAVYAHLVWCYLEHRSLRGLAAESRADRIVVDQALAALAGPLRQVLERLREALALYLTFLARLARFESVRQLVRLPLVLAGDGPFQWADLQRRLAKWGPQRLIVDDAFKRFFRTGVNPYVAGSDGGSQPDAWERAMPLWMRELYPQLALHVVFSAYLALQDDRAHHDAGRRQALERALERLVQEAPPRLTDTPSPQVEVSGLLVLRAPVLAAMEQAFNLIQMHCPQLRALPYEAYQQEHALESGLADAHARLVAMLWLATRLVQPRQYKTQHQQELTLAQRDDALRALKHFSVWRVAGGQWGSRRGQQVRAPALFAL